MVTLENKCDIFKVAKNENISYYVDDFEKNIGCGMYGSVYDANDMMTNKITIV